MQIIEHSIIGTRSAVLRLRCPGSQLQFVLTVFAGPVFHRGEDAERVLRGFRTATSQAPDELSTVLNLTTAPPAPFLPEAIHGKPVVAVLGMWSGRTEDGDAATRPLRELAPVVVDLFGPMPYTAMQSMLDALYPRGLRTYVRSAFFADLDDAAIGAFSEAYAQIPTPLSELHIHHLGGALGPDAAAYVNFTGEASADRVHASYPKDTYERLVAVKDRYDPANLFRLNQNIPPSGWR